MPKKSPERSSIPAQRSGQNTRYTIFLPGILILCTFLAFAPVLQNDFVNFDDIRLITGNPLVINGRDVMMKDFFLKNLYSPHYKPLVFLSWNIEYRLFGLNPKVFHLNNLLLHICNVILLWFTFRQFLSQYLTGGRKRSAGEQQWFQQGVPLVVSLLFALHPLHVESVAWASERKDLLCAFFYLLSLLCYLKYVQVKKTAWLILSAISYLMVIGSKSMGITLLAILFLADSVLGRKFSPRLIPEKIPHLAVFFAGLFVYGLFGHFTSYANGLTQGIIIPGHGSYPTHLDGLSPLYLRWMVISTRIMLWLQHIIIPVKLSPLYMQDTILENLGYSIHLLVPALMVLTGVIFGVRKKAPYLFNGFLFFLITLSPALAIDERGVGVFVPDRYTYIPMIGVLVMVTGIARHVFLANARVRYLAFITLACVLLFYGSSSLRLCRVWQNGESLWSHALERYPEEAAAWNGRGNYYNENKDTLRALHDFNRAIALDPACYWAYNSRARIWCGMGELDSALQDYLLITKVDPWFTEAFANLGAVYGMKGQYALALKALERADRLKPSDPDILLNRGVTYLNLQDYVRCIADLRAYLLHRPGNAEIINTVGVCYLRLGQVEEARSEFREALRIKPDFEICKNNLRLCP